MHVDCTSDHELTSTEMSAVLASCWPDFPVSREDIKARGNKGLVWQVPVPAPLAARLREGEQRKWENSATVAVKSAGGERVTVTLTFDPASADES